MDPNTKPPILFQWLDRILVAFSLTLGGAALAGMTGLSVWNVLIMRKALNSPIKGAEDVLIVTLVAIVAISIPLGARTGAHIEIEVLESRMSRSFAKWSHVVIKLLCIILLLVMSASLARRPVRVAWRNHPAADDFVRTLLLPDGGIGLGLRGRAGGDGNCCTRSCA